MGKVLLALKVVMVVVGVIFIIGLILGSLKVMPDHAVVYVNDTAKTYFGPPCIKTTVGLRAIAAGEARRIGYEPDRKCRDEGTFTQVGRSLTGIFFQSVGILGPKPSRWNENGSWNW